jgi:hypothetical protein
MTNMDRRSTAPTVNEVQEKLELVAARDELAVLDKLSQGLSAKISELVRQRPSFDRQSSDAEFAIHETRYSSLKGYQELAQHCYGRAGRRDR